MYRAESAEGTEDLRVVKEKIGTAVGGANDLALKRSLVWVRIRWGRKERRDGSSQSED
jgi:hypothetical protein